MTTPTAGGAPDTTTDDAAAVASPSPTGMASSTSPSSSRSSGDARRGQHDGTPPAAALTTVWRPPCPGGPISWDRSRTVLPRVEAFSPCLPEGWVTTGYFSPAICPSGYVSACGRFDAAQGPPVEAGETAVLCGPPGFTCNAKDAVYAKSDAFDAPMIQIRWRSSDISILQTHPLSPTSPVTTAGGSPTAAADTAASAADGGHGAGGGLPPGAIAAIIVGSMVAVALVVLAGLLPELPAEEVLVDDKKRPPFYNNRRAATRDSAAVTTVSDKRRLQRLQQRLQQSQQQQQEQQQQQHQQQQQQQQRRSIQELPGHEIPFEMGDGSSPSARPCELSATVVDVQEAAAVNTGGGGGGELEELRARPGRVVDRELFFKAEQACCQVDRNKGGRGVYLYRWEEDEADAAPRE
ncbi:hypothetical protein GGTG_01979 [Gaeumannomyces tritici R3-111a-1]|uniref:Uncharacterized protein n=1 Tax=Gaeumannomyces tritici (strain R3-111a-1) TaxID=644352 RepID=J3NL38_GAET3|nr:hypothetical protein GGTG_01979 [Gaeumannomyces tritici R3-111a-1]EJT82005.1 hypothetical protein GGTG_01979 [Gaeumannomyces tritici R3-111a-1]